MDPPPLHPDAVELAWLLGTWRGRGAGAYPTIEPFEYDEIVVVGHVGKPFLTYAQRTVSVPEGAPLHAETGYWRVPSPGRVELVLAHPSGIVEIEEGAVTGRRIELRSTAVAGSTSAKSVTELRRVFERSGDRLVYDLWMAAVGVPLTHHLRAELELVADRPG